MPLRGIKVTRHNHKKKLIIHDDSYVGLFKDPNYLVFPWTDDLRQAVGKIFDIDARHLSNVNNMKRFMIKYRNTIVSKSILHDHNDKTFNFFEVFYDKLNWCTISEKYNLSEDLLDKNFNKINKSHVSRHYKISEEFITNHFNDLDIITIL